MTVPKEEFIRQLSLRWAERPFLWVAEPVLRDSSTRFPVPGAAKVLALAPHPDDPETSAVALRLLKDAGCEIWYVIVCLSPGGVQDSFVEGHEDGLDARKENARKAEQKAAAESFGLSPSHLTFLELPEGDLLDSEENRIRVASHLEWVEPDLVVLPTGKDTNRTHAWVCSTFRSAAPALARKRGQPLVAFYNEDPKTLSLRDDLFVLFSEDLAQWKRRLLRFHDSQQQRNLATRGFGFDERIIEVSRGARGRAPVTSEPTASSAEYAEAFEIEVFAP